MPDPKNPHGYAVGQAWCLCVDDRHRGHRFHDVVVSKVGRKYVYFDYGAHRRDFEIPIRADSLYYGGLPARLFRTREDAESRIAAEAAWLALYRQLTATPPPNVTAATVAAIRNLLNMPEKPG